MSEITIKFEQRILGRNPGDVEVTEVTPFISALLLQGRVSLVSGDVDMTPPAAQYPEPVVYGVEPEDEEVAEEAAATRRAHKAKDVEAE